MSAQQMGNFGGAFPHVRLTGSGRTHQKTSFGHVTLPGKNGEVVFLPANALYTKMGTLFQGIAVQAIGTAAATISLTLADVDLACNPAQTGIWVSPTTVAAGSIVKLPSAIVTVLKIEFTGDGILYFAGV